MLKIIKATRTSIGPSASSRRAIAFDLMSFLSVHAGTGSREDGAGARRPVRRSGSGLAGAPQLRNPVDVPLEAGDVFGGDDWSAGVGEDRDEALLVDHLRELLEHAGAHIRIGLG